ncbi:MAG: cobalamin B12-binding domain-containing protein [Methanophagales archaeon]|nr:cobalamin B12-binding domain-containing protein [Methanophagales archaeon]
MKKRILLVEPDFPIPIKSKNHKNFLPIGLLKIASYLRSKGIEVKLVRGITKGITDLDILSFNPQEVWITSLFTYWAKYVKDAVRHYKHVFPNAKIVVGGIYASFMPDHCKKFTGCDEVKEGVLHEAEKYFPAYDLITNANPHPIDYQIIHTSRGCIRNCEFCGVKKIEPNFKPKSSVKEEIKKRKVVFYDNNFLANTHIEDILRELIDLKKRKKILWCESQSGFDGRVLKERPYLGELLKKVGFRDPRIAWDWGYGQFQEIEEQIGILRTGGYNSQDIYVFMLYNWEIPFEEMERKRIKCWEWKVQIADCRYRPLDQTFDEYNPWKKDQTKEDYHIHTEAGWTDALVKQFRKNVRRQNICVRHSFPFFSNVFEKKRVEKEVIRAAKLIKTKEEKIRYLQQIQADYWFPDEITYP